ncbi:MAG: C2H2-type zinc finger protein [Verrucomicrobia bacterium]|nr:C2H2-type zinc finger protein [Verrucomicrobiota bacterium]
MGFWHTGYMEFHEPVGLGDRVADVPAPLFACPQCNRVFTDFDDLRRHRFGAHPALRPLLFVRGVEVGSAPLRLTRPLSSADVQTMHATTAVVNGRALSSEKVATTLAAFKSSVVEIRLEGAASAEFKLKFEIATESDLAGVERCFAEAARRGRLDRRAVEAFIDSARPYGSAIAYCDGICEYLYGVLAKEGNSSPALPFADHREKFNRAAEVLRDVDRPLARQILALVAFNLNHFSLAASLAPATRVAAASKKYLAWTSSRPAPSCDREGLDQSDSRLTDLDTESIIRWSLLPLGAVGEHRDELEQALQRDISEFDRAKVRLLLTEYLLNVRDFPRAKLHARELWNNPAFGPWAEVVLSRES